MVEQYIQYQYNKDIMGIIIVLFILGLMWLAKWMSK